MTAELGLQFAAAGMLLLGLWLMGNHRRSGPLLAAASEAVWIGVFVPHALWGGVFLSTILLGMQARNFWKWSREGAAW